MLLLTVSVKISSLLSMKKIVNNYQSSTSIYDFCFVSFSLLNKFICNGIKFAWCFIQSIRNGINFANIRLHFRLVMF